MGNVNARVQLSLAFQQTIGMHSTGALSPALRSFFAPQNREVTSEACQRDSLSCRRRLGLRRVLPPPGRLSQQLDGVLGREVSCFECMGAPLGGIPRRTNAWWPMPSLAGLPYEIGVLSTLASEGLRVDLLPSVASQTHGALAATGLGALCTEDTLTFAI